MAKKSTKNKGKNNNDKPSYREKKCYKCGGKVTQKDIIYENTKWGGGEKFPEKAKAFVCEKCNEKTFSSEETKRLQELSRSYQ